jgi:hypothetical protein
MIRNKVLFFKRKFKYRLLPYIKEYNLFDFKTYVFMTNDLERIYSTPKSRFKNLIETIIEFTSEVLKIK